MTTYILKRFLQLIPVFLGATLLVYFLVFSLPGDPIVALFGDKPVTKPWRRNSGSSTTWTSRSGSSICST